MNRLIRTLMLLEVVLGGLAGGLVAAENSLTAAAPDQIKLLAGLKDSAETQNLWPRLPFDDTARTMLISQAVSNRSHPENIQQTPMARSGLPGTLRRNPRPVASHRYDALQPFVADRSDQAMAYPRNPRAPWRIP